MTHGSLRVIRIIQNVPVLLKNVRVLGRIIHEARVLALTALPRLKFSPFVKREPKCFIIREAKQRVRENASSSALFEKDCSSVVEMATFLDSDGSRIRLVGLELGRKLS
jgi:hypothetical protein